MSKNKNLIHALVEEIYAQVSLWIFLYWDWILLENCILISLKDTLLLLEIWMPLMSKRFDVKRRVRLLIVIVVKKVDIWLDSIWIF
jgi:hypothetical protein